MKSLILVFSILLLFSFQFSPIGTPPEPNVTYQHEHISDNEIESIQKIESLERLKIEIDGDLDSLYSMLDPINDNAIHRADNFERYGDNIQFEIVENSGSKNRANEQRIASFQASKRVSKPKNRAITDSSKFSSNVRLSVLEKFRAKREATKAGKDTTGITAGNE